MALRLLRAPPARWAIAGSRTCYASPLLDERGKALPLPPPLEVEASRAKFGRYFSVAKVTRMPPPEWPVADLVAAANIPEHGSFLIVALQWSRTWNRRVTGKEYHDCLDFCIRNGHGDTLMKLIIAKRKELRLFMTPAELRTAHERAAVLYARRGDTEHALTMVRMLKLDRLPVSAESLDVLVGALPPKKSFMAMLGRWQGQAGVEGVETHRVMAEGWVAAGEPVNAAIRWKKYISEAGLGEPRPQDGELTPEARALWDTRDMTALRIFALAKEGENTKALELLPERIRSTDLAGVDLTPASTDTVEEVGGEPSDGWDMEDNESETSSA